MVGCLHTEEPPASAYCCETRNSNTLTSYEKLRQLEHFSTMTDIEYGSLSGALQASEESGRNPDAASIARRSISIFSRRGADTTDQKRASLSQAAMAICPTKKMSERQHTWLRRKSMDVRKTHEKATILNAVPPAERIQMSRLEREMATGPNEEIMSAISARPSAQDVWDTNLDHATGPSPQSPSGWLHPDSTWHANTVQRTESSKRRETNSRVGVWVDGIAHWDETIEQQHPQHTVDRLDLWTASSVSNVLTDSMQGSSANARPNLTVTIPGPWQSVPAVRQQEVALVAPANTVSKFEHAPPRVVVDKIATELQRSNNTKEPTAAHYDNNLEVQPDYRRISSSTASSTAGQSDASIYSKRSSTTSVDPVPATACQQDYNLDLQKPLPRVPLPRNMRAAPVPPSNPNNDSKIRVARVKRSAPGTTKQERHSQDMRTMKKPSFRSLLDLDAIDADFIRASPYAPSLSGSISEADTPTLSQAEYDLQAQLGTIDEILGHEDTADILAATTSHRHGTTTHDSMDTAHVGITKPTDLHRSDSVHSVMQPPARAPTLPKRSRRRDWRATTQVDATIPQVIRPPPKAPGRRKSESVLAHNLAKQTEGPDTAINVHRSESEKVATGIKDRYGRSLIYRRSPGITPPAHSSPEIILDPHEEAHEALISQVLPAEQVLLHILSSLTSLKDLSNMAIINKGMYRVFKENELHLVKTATRNGSSAAWELREWRAYVDDDGDDDEEATGGRRSSLPDNAALSYCRSQRCDADTVTQLKQLILDNCQTFMRRETALSFAHPNHPGSQRFTDAFWRVWTFCTIFGSEKGREEDITGQLDWLKGGTEANNQSFSATVNTNLDFDMGSILLNAPEHFAQGNKGGLSATQLYDMTELWNCLSALLTGYLGQVDEARRCGIFAHCQVKEGDIELEEHMLEEWIAFVMTLGLDVVLELAKHAVLDPGAGFELAKANGWNVWSPSVTGSRATFLREPAARLYEERISAAALQMQSLDDMERKETARKRVAALAAEIRLRRQTSGYKRLPLIDMHSERAMSMISRRSSAVPTRSAEMVQTSNLPPATRYHAYSTQSARPLPPPSHDGIVSPLSHMPSNASARPSSPSSLWSSRHISPIIEGRRVEAFNRLSLANLDGIAESTVELAVKKITEMGFTQAQATHALRMTDMGDGLRVDRAVDMLLRNC
jgi:hypothetical protein